MGLFGDIGSFFSGAVNKVVKTVTNPTKLTTAVLTGGLSVVAPKVTKPVSSLVANTLYNPALLSPIVGAATKNPALLASGSGLSSLGGTPKMGLDLGGIFGTVSNIFGGNQNPIFQGISNVAGFGAQLAPSSQAIKSVVPMVMPAAGRAVATVGRSFFQRFPNLATSIQQWRNMGKNITRAQLYGWLRRFGPDFLVTAGILTAAAVQELVIAGPGRRRMNPANVRALRRSVRRLKSFDRLSSQVSRQLTRVGGRRGSSKRRCVTCRKSPCAC